MNTANNTDIPAPAPKILRLLSGALNGCEFNIESSRVLVVAGSRQHTEEAIGLMDLPADTLVIPGSEESHNFEIEFNETNDQHYVIRELASGPPVEHQAMFNNPVEVQGTLFAVKHPAQAWSSSVLGKLSEDTLPPQKSRTRKGLKWACLAVITVFMLCTGYYYFRSEADPAPGKILTLQRLLSNTSDLNIINGRDGVTYILVKTHRKLNWVNQVLARNPLNFKVNVVYPEKEMQRMDEWLSRSHPELKYFRLAFDNITQPALIISKQRTPLSEEKHHALRRELLMIMPYADDIIITVADDSMILAQADQILGSLGVQFTRHNETDYISYTIEGELTDSELVRIQSFINEFYYQWGDKFIQFHIALVDNELKDKSYSFGRYNYIKNTPSKWFFISPRNP